MLPFQGSSWSFSSCQGGSAAARRQPFPEAPVAPASSPRAATQYIIGVWSRWREKAGELT